MWSRPTPCDVSIVDHEIENGYEVLEEVEDGGYSGACLERPGLVRVRELVAFGNVDAVVALFRDRIARGVYAQLLSEEFREQGARLVALNSRGDGSPDGELGTNVLDLIAAWERKNSSAVQPEGLSRRTSARLQNDALACIRSSQ